MKYIAILITMFASSAYASAPETCLEMTRDYLLSKDAAQPEMLIDYKRERFMASCKADDAGFNQALTELVVEDSFIYAIHDDRDTVRLDSSSYRI